MNWWTRTTSPSLTQCQCPINKGCSSNLGGLSRVWRCCCGKKGIIQRRWFQGNGRDGQSSISNWSGSGVLGQGMGCNLGEIHLHNRVGGQGHQRNKEVMRKYYLVCLYNEGICEGP